MTYTRIKFNAATVLDQFTLKRKYNGYTGTTAYTGTPASGSTDFVANVTSSDGFSEELNVWWTDSSSDIRSTIYNPNAVVKKGTTIQFWYSYQSMDSTGANQNGFDAVGLCDLYFMGTDENNCYCLRFDGNGGYIGRIEKIVNGVRTVLVAGKQYTTWQKDLNIGMITLSIGNDSSVKCKWPIGVDPTGGSSYYSTQYDETSGMLDNTYTNTGGVGFGCTSITTQKSGEASLTVRDLRICDEGIVTSGLIAYWNTVQDLSGTTWKNLAPNTLGTYDGTVYGSPAISNDGIDFDGVDDRVAISGSFDLSTLSNSRAFTIDFQMKLTTIEDTTKPKVFYFSNGTGVYLEDFDSSATGINDMRQLYKTTTANTNTNYINGARFHHDQTIMQNITVVDPNYRATGYTTGYARIYNSSMELENASYDTGASTINKAPEVSGTLTLGANNNGTELLKSSLRFLRIYNRALTEDEVAKNLIYTDNVGIVGAASPPASPPVVTVNNVNHNKISDETGMSSSVITFKFDQDVTQWKVMVGGNTPDTGTLADSGTTLTANTNATATVDWNEGLVEGDNRVNIYGLNATGWTPYNS